MLQYFLLMEDLLNFGVCKKYVDKYDYSTDCAVISGNNYQKLKFSGVTSCTS